jgi:hypothetical protein
MKEKNKHWMLKKGMKISLFYSSALHVMCTYIPQGDDVGVVAEPQ